MEGDLGGESGVEAAERVGPLAVEAEGEEEAVVDGLDDLAEAAVPASEGRGPVLLGGAVGRADDPGAEGVAPVLVAVGADEAGIDQVRLEGVAADGRQAGVGGRARL